MSHLSPAAEPFSNPGLHADAGPDWAAGPWKDPLAAYFQSLWGTVIHLQHKVQELEDWKKKALEDVRKLRDEHKVLRRKVLGEEPVEHVRSSVRAKTMPPAHAALSTDSQDSWKPQITCFGEAMLRYVPDPEGGEQSPFAAKWLRSVGGAELNITVALSKLGQL
eukprot:g27828.t2